jgi:ABC-2 type transport system permease protein
LGFVGGGVARGLVVGVIVTWVAFFFTKLQITHLPIIIGAILLAAILFSLAGFLNGIYAKKFDDISFVPTFILTPLTYLGGVFYSVNLLPPFWQNISLFNPILHMVNVFRYGLLGISDVSVVGAFSIITLMIVLLYVLNIVLLRRGVGLKA